MGVGVAAVASPPVVRTAGRPVGEVRSQPNIILLMADDCSAKEFALYGGTVKTPNLEKLARTGVMFQTCWCTPICSPTRAEIMTGRYGFRTGWFHNDMKPDAQHPKGNLSNENLIFAQVLKKAGYATAITGKWQLRGTMKAHGFDEHCMWQHMKGKFDGPVEQKGHQLPGRAARYWHPAIVKNDEHVPTTATDYGPDIYTDFVIDFAKRHRDGPFLVYYPMCLPHVSWDFELNKGTYVPSPELDADGKRTGKRTADTIEANIKYMDHLVGRIIRALDEMGIRDNTVFLFTCDNGTVRYGKGQVVQERGPRVPMVINGPGIVKPIGESDELIDFSDILPTLAELGGTAVPSDYVIDGKSFAGYLRGEKPAPREWIFSFCAGARMLRDKRWLLDGKGKLYDCGGKRNEQGYKDVTASNAPEAVAARERFEKILADLPAPNPDDPWVKAYAGKKTKKKAARQRQKAGKQRSKQ